MAAAQTAAPASPAAAPTAGVNAAQAPVSLAVSAETTVSGGRLHGVVKSGNTPLPGVTVTAENTLTGRRYTTTTDITGAWSMTIPKDGRYVVRTEFAAFAQQAQEALLNSTKSRDQVLNFSLMLASRAAEQEQQQSTGQARIQQAIRELAANGPQSMSLASALNSETEAASGATESAAGNGAALPSAAGNTDFSSDSVSINGQSGQVSPLAGMDENKLRDIVETLRAEGAIGGLFGGGMGGFGGAFGGNFITMGPGGPGGGRMGGGRGGPGGGRGFVRIGNFRNFDPSQPHGAVFWFGSNSALNAQPFSLEGQQQEQPANGSNRFGLTFMSEPYIPRLTKPSGKDTVFLTLSGTRSSSPEDQYATVPTAAQRAGDLGNGITVTPVPEAVALMNYIPMPNLPATVQGYNYHLLTTAQSNTTQAGFRYMRSLGASSSPFPFGGRGGGFGSRRSNTNQGLRQSINVNYNWAHTAKDDVGLIPILGGKAASDQYSLQAGYTLGYHRFTNILNVNWSRSNSSTTNFFTNGTDIATQLGILGPGGTPLNSSALNYGLPNVSITDFPSGGIKETQPTFNISQTISLTETFAWRHGTHNFRFGGDYRRVHHDVLGGGNGTGSFSFTGAYTQAAYGLSAPVPLGDFLLGEPLQTTIASADGKSYLRDNVFDGYAQDDWRVRPSLTLVYGIRYEYFAPYTEKYNRLSMVDTNPDGGFTSVGQVEAGATSSGYGPLRDSLLFPYRTAFAPRLGFAWRVPKIKSMVVRGGYGMNYEEGEYGSFAVDTAYQPPFVNEQSNVCQSKTSCYSLANGFPAPNTVGTYAINPHYLLPHVQAYSLDVQKTLPWGIVMNLGYNGATAGNMDIKIAPRQTPSSPNTNPDNTPFYYLESGAFYRMNAGTLRVNKRLSNGIALGANYEWMHAIDNAGGVGGNSSLTAQNWQDIGAEVSNSTIDQRHSVTGSYLYELPFGKDKRWVTTGTASHILEGFSISGTFTFATGTPLNLTYSGSTLGVQCGTASSLRPRYTGEPVSAGGGTLQQWFNTGAFGEPSVNKEYPCASFGNVPRDSLTGPGTVENNLSLSKTLQLGDTRSWEFRATASNAFNTVQYSGVDTNATSPTFGRVMSVGNMRSFQFTSRFRF